jgi:hypothetical protein
VTTIAIAILGGVITIWRGIQKRRHELRNKTGRKMK